MDLDSSYSHSTGKERIDIHSYKQTYRTGSEPVGSVTDQTAGHPDVPQTTDEPHHHDDFQVLSRESGRKGFVEGTILAFEEF